MMREITECGKHRAGDHGSYVLYDMNRIPCVRVCFRCEAKVVRARPRNYYGNIDYDRYPDIAPPWGYPKVDYELSG